MYLRNGAHTAHLVEKLLFFNLKTKPVRLDSLEDIYRHVMMVKWRYMLYMHERSLRADIIRTKKDGSRVVVSKGVSSVSDEQKIEIIVDGPEAFDHWKQHINSMINQVSNLTSPTNTNNEHDQTLKRKIHWAVQLLQLYF